MERGRLVDLRRIITALQWGTFTETIERIWWDDFCWAWHEIAMSAVLGKLDVKGVEW